MTLMRGTPKNPSAEGYLSAEEFLDRIDAGQAMLDAERAAQPESAIAWDEYLQHEWSERLTRSYLEPSAERVAEEWGVTVAEVEALGLETHLDEEYPELGAIYLRADVDAARVAREPGWAPYPGPMDDRFEDPGRELVGTGELACEQAGSSPCATPPAGSVRRPARRSTSAARGDEVLVVDARSSP